MIALLAAAILAAPPSPVVIPRPTIPLAFSHPQHMKLGMKCTSCHADAQKSIDAADVLFPKEELCTKCHRLDAPDPAKAFPKSSCETCHPGFVKERDSEPAGVIVPPPRLRNTHRAHTKIGILCTDCHSGLDKLTKPSSGAWGSTIPTMGKCLECHNGNAAPGACTTCHLAEDDGRLVTSWPEGRLAPSGRYRDDDHRDPAWAYRHGMSARDEAYCASCHAAQDCLDCHAGAEKPRDIHPGNWILLHSQAALTRSAECLGCHEGGVGCQKCHETTGVTQAATREPGARVSRSVHPPGFGGFAVGENHHSAVARTSLDACASCHTEEECIRCHSTNTLGVNPHPKGFTGSVLEARNDKVCKKCHVTTP